MPIPIISDRPVVYAIGGPNGAGKTTFAREFLPAVGIEQFLTPTPSRRDCRRCAQRRWRSPGRSAAAQAVASWWRRGRASRSRARSAAGRTHRCCATSERQAISCRYATSGCQTPTPRCGGSAGEFLREGTTCLQKIFAGAICRPCATSSSFISRSPMLRCCTEPDRGRLS